MDLFGSLVFTGIFTKGGQELFRAEMVAGYVSILTGYRRGQDGFAIERNTRYADHVDGNEEMLHHLLGGRTLNGWSLRKILEEESTYDGALARVKTVPFVSTEYNILSGVRKGHIVSRNPDAVAFLQTLGAPNFDEPPEYILITNFDFFWCARTPPPSYPCSGRAMLRTCSGGRRIAFISGSRVWHIAHAGATCASGSTPQEARCSDHAASRRRSC